jgi:hypothetical protein
MVRADLMQREPGQETVRSDGLGTEPVGLAALCPRIAVNVARIPRFCDPATDLRAEVTGFGLQRKSQPPFDWGSR